METGDGDGGETGAVTEEGIKIYDQYQCQPHPGIKRRALTSCML